MSGYHSLPHDLTAQRCVLALIDRLRYVLGLGRFHPAWQVAQNCGLQREALTLLRGRALGSMIDTLLDLHVDPRHWLAPDELAALGGLVAADKELADKERKEG